MGRTDDDLVEDYLEELEGKRGEVLDLMRGGPLTVSLAMSGAGLGPDDAEETLEWMADVGICRRVVAYRPTRFGRRLMEARDADLRRVQEEVQGGHDARMDLRTLAPHVPGVLGEDGGPGNPLRNLFAGDEEMTASSGVDHPSHYRKDSGIEAIDVIEAWGLGFNLGNAIKYICRAGQKYELKSDDLEKAVWYLRREIENERKGRKR